MKHLSSRLGRLLAITSLGLSASYANANTFNCDAIAHWDKSSTYTGGKQAQYDNSVYRAKWWTRNANPSQNSGPWQVWENKGNCQANNLPPEVILISPANGSTFVIGDNVWITADASDSDGQINHVEFFINGLPAGIAHEAPYQIQWQADVEAHDIVAVAVDDQQAETLSTIHNIHVKYPRTTLLDIHSASMGFQQFVMNEVATNIWQQTAHLQRNDSSLNFLLGNDPEPMLYGDFEQDSIADIHGPSIEFKGFSGDYTITLDENNFNYRIERQFEQQLPFERNLERLSLNAWGDFFSINPEFKLVNDHSWEVEVDLQKDISLVFEVAGIATPLIFGDFENDRIADEFGPEIKFNGIAGHYLIRFNDQTMSYSIEQKFTSELPYTRNFEAARAHIWSPNSGMPLDFTLVDDHTWEARFSQIDAESEIHIEQLGSDPAMPLAIFGDNENDGIAEENALPIRNTAVRGDYILSFNDQTLAYNIRRDFVTQLPFDRNFEAARAHIWSPSSGIPLDFTLVDDHTWEARFSQIDAESEIHIEQLGSDPAMPLAIFGDNENDGIAEENALPIRNTAVRGDYILSFNDQTFAYNIRRDFITQLPFSRNFEAARAHIWSPSSGMPLDLILVDDHTWEARFSQIDAESEIHIEQLGSDPAMPLAIFGDHENDGIAEENALPIRNTAVRGDYILSFNDQTFAYNIRRDFVTQLPFNRNFEAARAHIWSPSSGMPLDLILVDDHTWEARFSQIDAESEIHIEQLGSDPVMPLAIWGESNNDGIADENGLPIRHTAIRGDYVLRFNDQTLAYSIDRDYVTQLPYARNFEAARAHIWSPNSGMPLDLTLVDDHTWEAHFNRVDIETEIHIEQLGADSMMPLAIFGDNENDGIAEENALPIRSSGVRGNYILSFNDQTLAYNIRRDFVTQLPYARNFEAARAHIWSPSSGMPLDLTLADDHTWEVRFNQVDSETEIHIEHLGADPMMPLAIFGENNNDGIADEAGLPIRHEGSRGDYILSFNDQTLEYSIKRDFVTQLPYARNMEAVQAYIFGREVVDLTLITDNTWQVVFQKDDLDSIIHIWQSEPTDRIWFGDTNNDGIAEEGAPDIKVSGDIGVYTLTFNDQSLAYRIEPKFITPPQQ